MLYFMLIGVIAIAIAVWAVLKQPTKKMTKEEWKRR